MSCSAGTRPTLPFGEDICLFYMTMKLKPVYLLWLLLPWLVACSNDETPEVPGEEGETEEVWTENYHFKLPVVFHVLYANPNDAQQNPSKEHLDKILKGLNEVYANCGVDLNMEFVPATEDPEGNVMEEPGIDRVQWTNKSIYYQAFMDGYEQRYLDVLWDQNKYINIVFYKFADAEGSTAASRVQGISTFPTLVKPAQLSGFSSLDEAVSPGQLKKAVCVSINNDCINALRDDYTTFDEENYDAQDVVVTLAHEVGHYLGLYHAFSTDDSKNDTDYCSDTPIYNRTEYNEILGQYTSWEEYSKHFSELVWRTDCDGNKYKSDNIMDYVVSYRNKFTAQQRDRIRYILDNAILMPGPKKPQTEEAKSLTSRTSGQVDIPVRFSE